MKTIGKGFLLAIGWEIGRTFVRAFDKALDKSFEKNFDWYKNLKKRNLEYYSEEETDVYKPVMGFKG